jgi:hypothetical protein
MIVAWCDKCGEMTTQVILYDTIDIIGDDVISIHHTQCQDCGDEYEQTIF